MGVMLNFLRNIFSGLFLIVFALDF